MANAKSVIFTLRELREVLRAMDLIMMEDASADVNMDGQSVRAKRSALAKLQQARQPRRQEV